MFFTKKMKVETVTKQLKDDYIHFFEKFIMEFEIFGINKEKMTVRIFSKHSRNIQKLVREQMQQEIEELGFDPFGDGAQDEYERRIMDLEQESFRNSEI